jgi:L-asparaginase
VTGKKIAVLGTGGTIAGTAARAEDNVGYTAAQLGVDGVLAGVPVPGGWELVAEQVAQIDSKNMSFDVWRNLAVRCAHWLAQDDVSGVVITHGTDTVEETAYFLDSVLAAGKPVVLTCAIRPATSMAPDGPQNLADALTVASTPEARGVVVVCAGTIHRATDVAKQHVYRLDAFSSGDAGPLGFVEEGKARLPRGWPPQSQHLLASLDRVVRATRWPRVEIVMNHVGANGSVVRALMSQGVDGLVVAGTGNGTMSDDLLASLLDAHANGIRVVRTSRCAQGQVIESAGDPLPGAGTLSPVKARIKLWLDLLAA